MGQLDDIERTEKEGKESVEMGDREEGLQHLILSIHVSETMVVCVCSPHGCGVNGHMTRSLSLLLLFVMQAALKLYKELSVFNRHLTFIILSSCIRWELSVLVVLLPTSLLFLLIFSFERKGCI